MIYLELFLTFLQIGAFSFGGGYGMIPLIRDQVLSHGWMTEEELLNRIAVSESTPGPIAVNVATFVGASQAGVPGALVATVGVVLPSFLIILLIAALIGNLLKYAGVKAFLGGVRPVVVGLILGTGIILLLRQCFALEALTNLPEGGVNVDFRGLALFALLVLVGFVWKKRLKKAPSPILLILLSAGLGMILYGVIPTAF